MRGMQTSWTAYCGLVSIKPRATGSCSRGWTVWLRQCARERAERSPSGRNRWHRRLGGARLYPPTVGHSEPIRWRGKLLAAANDLSGGTDEARTSYRRSGEL